MPGKWKFEERGMREMGMGEKGQTPGGNGMNVRNTIIVARGV
jgi:hypothetical protein